MGRTVLIVDEDVNAQIIAETLLQLRGHEVHLAGDGDGACDTVRDEDVAVIVLDLSLSGFDLLRRLRGQFQPQLRQPRIIAVTDRQATEVERFALWLGADMVLHKPLAPGQFIDAVEGFAEDLAPQAA